MTTAPFTVAIDGPAAAGKGTVARALAETFGFAHLDTGLLYRGVGLATLQGVAAVEAAETLNPMSLDDSTLRKPEVADAASRVAAIPEVRAALLDVQRAFARRAGGAVLDGRDIATVICPQAEVKLFVTASTEVRAERRYAELVARGLDTDLESVLADVEARDARDMKRSAAPLRPATDAKILNTSYLSITEAVEQAHQIVEEKLSAIRPL